MHPSTCLDKLAVQQLSIPGGKVATINAIINFLDKLAWGIPEQMPYMIILLVGTGIFITIRMGFPQFRRLKHSIDVTRGIYDNPADAGDITHFQALSTALSATIGIGNISGVALAIHYGGPGALFWMWITGLFGTSLKFAECTLSMKFRKINPDGSASGGPMYYIEQALGWKWLAVIFATATAISALGQGNSIQGFTVADQLRADFAIPAWLTGLVISLLVAAVIIGGIRRIAKVTRILAPAMTVIYVAGGLLVILLNIDKIPDTFDMIFKYAFSPHGMIGGFAGSAFMQTLIWGFKRGLFSNEAGQGSAAIAHSAAKTKEPVREGTVAMMGPYIDTIIVCTITGLCILVTGAWTDIVDGQALNGSPLTAHAFGKGLVFLGGYGRYIVTGAVLLFATSTIISWSYYGDRAVQYLFGNSAVMPYRYLYVVVLFIGCVARLEPVWNFGDFAIAFMTIPNLIALLALSKVTRKMTVDYFSREQIPYRKLH
jgi:AGCS family alanine or glycine:cation symporter